MATFILTLLPFALTVTVAAWNGPASKLQPRSAISGCRASH
jgi:hypothetical protein